MSGTTDPWMIWAQDGDAVKRLAVGSVRLGRTLRRASRLKKWMNCTVFVAKERENGLPTTPDRHYPSELARNNG